MRGSQGGNLTPQGLQEALDAELHESELFAGTRCDTSTL